VKGGELPRYVQIKPLLDRRSVCHACACTGAEGFPIGGIGGYTRLRAFPCASQKDWAKYRPRRATLAGLLVPTTTASRTADQASRSFARIWIPPKDRPDLKDVCTYDRWGRGAPGFFEPVRFKAPSRTPNTSRMIEIECWISFQTCS
jgi:hypothetical protein